MQINIKLLFVFIALAIPLFANQENPLQQAPGSCALSSEQIKRLYSWNQSKEISIGIDDRLQVLSDAQISSQYSGLILDDPSHFSQEEFCNQSELISFENVDQPSFEHELVAEQEARQYSHVRMLKVDDSALFSLLERLFNPKDLGIDKGCISTPP